MQKICVCIFLEQSISIDSKDLYQNLANELLCIDSDTKPNSGNIGKQHLFVCGGFLKYLNKVDYEVFKFWFKFTLFFQYLYIFACKLTIHPRQRKPLKLKQEKFVLI